MESPASTPRAKLLLTSVIRPFGGPGEGDSVGAELFHAQVTRAQGPFSLRQVIRVWAIDYLAENVEAPTVTLHYPSRRELIRELESGDYTHVGINFVVATFHKVREMVPLIRRFAPNAKIILGGYGTVLPDEVLAPWADAICREEGVQFLRRTLGENVDRPLRHPHAPIPSVQVLGFQLRAVVGHVTTRSSACKAVHRPAWGGCSSRTSRTACAGSWRSAAHNAAAKTCHPCDHEAAAHAALAAAGAHAELDALMRHPV